MKNDARRLDHKTLTELRKRAVQSVQAGENSEIARKFGIHLRKASVCRLLNQLGVTPQRPVWRTYQQ